MTGNAAAIRRQVEFYFSDVNVAKDVFLKSKMAEDAEGFVGLDVLLTFNRLNALTKDAQVVAEALKESDKLVLDTARMAVRRKDPLPESIQTDEQTVYVKPVPASATLEELTEFFAKHGTVLAIWRRYFPGDKSADAASRTKPSVFVVFGSKEEAERFQSAPPVMDGVQLTAQMKQDYLQAKAAEAAARNKSKRTTATTTPATTTTTPPMPLGSSYRITGCGEIAKFTDVKALWPAEEQKGVRYVFTPSKEVALVVFQDAATGELMAESVRERAATLNGKPPSLVKLEGEEEKELIAGVEKEIAERARSRGAHAGGRGGGRGRGGKRPRH